VILSMGSSPAKSRSSIPAQSYLPYSLLTHLPVLAGDLPRRSRAHSTHNLFVACAIVCARLMMRRHRRYDGGVGRGGTL